MAWMHQEPVRQSSALLTDSVTTVCKPETGGADLFAVANMFGKSFVNALSQSQMQGAQHGFYLQQGYGYQHGMGTGPSHMAMVNTMGKIMGLATGAARGTAHERLQLARRGGSWLSKMLCHQPNARAKRESKKN